MAIVNNIETIKASLNKIPIKAGQQIFCSDTAEIYHDGHDGMRKQISDIIKLNTEADRIDILAPLNNKLYLVLETNTLYRYSGNWIQLNNNHIVSFSKNTVTISSNVAYVDLGIPSFEPTDMLLVFLNSTYVENSEYTVKDKKLYPIEGGWIADSTNKLIFNFVALKNVTDVNNAMKFSRANFAMENENELTELYNELGVLTRINFENRVTLKNLPSIEMMKQYYINSPSWDKNYLNELLQKKYITQSQYDEIIR